MESSVSNQERLDALPPVARDLFDRMNSAFLSWIVEWEGADVDRSVLSAWELMTDKFIWSITEKE